MTATLHGLHRVDVSPFMAAPGRGHDDDCGWPLRDGDLDHAGMGTGP